MSSPDQLDLASINVYAPDMKNLKSSQNFPMRGLYGNGRGGSVQKEERTIMPNIGVSSSRNAGAFSTLNLKDRKGRVSLDPYSDKITRKNAETLSAHPSRVNSV